MKANTMHQTGTTLARSNPAPATDGKIRSYPEPQQQLMPEPYQSIPAQDLLKENCGKCGWIRKEGGSVKTWRDRYAILHKGCLYYYYKPESTTTAGKFSLSGYRMSPAPEKSCKYQWTFKLVHLQPEKRTYYFAAYSEREMNEWMESLSKEMEEYCGVGKQNIAETTEDAPEYFYPEVEPKFGPEELAALFGKPSPSLPRRPPPFEPAYCPPPEIDPRDIKKKSPCLPRAAVPYHVSHESEWPKGCSIPTASQLPMRSPNTLEKNSLPPPGASPVLPNNTKWSPAVPPRLAKPGVGHAPATPPKPKPRPKPLQRPPTLAKRNTEPIANYGGLSDDQDEEDVSEGYLDIVPDTTPADVVNEGKKSTLSRGYPDGNSFRHHNHEDVLPNSAVRLDLDKVAVTQLLENKLGVYILRESLNAQSKRALAVWTGDRVRHYMIFYEDKIGYALDPDGKRFEKVEELLQYYHDENLPKCDVRLRKPYK